MAMHGFLRKVFCAAFAIAPHGADDAHGVGDAQRVVDSDDDALDGHDREQKSIGKRKSKALHFVKDPGTPLAIQLSILFLAPLHYGFAWLLKVAGRRSSEAGSASCPVPILDVMHAPASPLTVIQQFFATIIMSPAAASHAAVLRGFFDEHGCITGSLISSLNRILLGASSSLFYRFTYRMGKMPFRLLQSCDVRLPGEERKRIAQEFAALRKCCVDAGATEPILTAMCAETGGVPGALDWQHVFVDEWQHMFRTVSREIDGLISDVEDRHARNKAAAQPGQSTEMLAARYVLAEAKNLQKSYVATSRSKTAGNGRDEKKE